MNEPLRLLKDLSPEVDYQALMAQLQHMAHPRRKLKELQNKNQLIRLKKGFYVFTPGFIGKAYSPQIVANLLYGPSYLSLEFALAWYGLIPERVEVLTSVTSGKNKQYATPIGPLTYRHLPASLYPLGVTLKKNDDGRTFLIATPEKALVDLFTLKFKNSDLPQPADLVSALRDDLRLDVDEFKKTANRELLADLRPHYEHRRWPRLLLDHLLGET